MRGLYVITDSVSQDEPTLVAAVEQALLGGACMVQYREKRETNVRREPIALQLHALCRQYGAPLIINDDVRLAQLINADGVHLGIDDLVYEEARDMLGPGKIIGVSCYDDLARAQQAQQQGADYVAFGRFFDSQTKPQASPANLELLAQAKAQLQLPLVAIGGINAQNGAPLVAAGADMLAVVHGVFGQSDTLQAARDLSALFA